jgi:hypothetical protein
MGNKFLYQHNDHQKNVAPIAQDIFMFGFQIKNNVSQPSIK